MEGFCRNFPEYTDQMKVFIQRETGDASLCRTALSVLESLVTLLQQLMDGKTDLRQLIEATLVDGDGRPRTEHGQRPSELLVELPKMAIRPTRNITNRRTTSISRPVTNGPQTIKKATFLPPQTVEKVRLGIKPRRTFSFQTGKATVYKGLQAV